MSDMRKYMNLIEGENFETQKSFGNQVKSKDVFSDYKVDAKSEKKTNKKSVMDGTYRELKSDVKMDLKESFQVFDGYNKEYAETNDFEEAKSWVLDLGHGGDYDAYIVDSETDEVYINNGHERVELHNMDESESVEDGLEDKEEILLGGESDEQLDAFADEDKPSYMVRNHPDFNKETGKIEEDATDGLSDEEKSVWVVGLYTGKDYGDYEYDGKPMASGTPVEYAGQEVGKESEGTSEEAIIYELNKRGFDQFLNDYNLEMEEDKIVSGYDGFDFGWANPKQIEEDINSPDFSEFDTTSIETGNPGANEETIYSRLKEDYNELKITDDIIDSIKKGTYTDSDGAWELEIISNDGKRLNPLQVEYNQIIADLQAGKWLGDTTTKSGQVPEAYAEKFAIEDGLPAKWEFKALDVADATGHYNESQTIYSRLKESKASITDLVNAKFEEIKTGLKESKITSEKAVDMLMLEGLNSKRAEKIVKLAEFQNKEFAKHGPTLVKEGCFSKKKVNEEIDSEQSVMIKRENNDANGNPMYSIDAPDAVLKQLKTKLGGRFRNDKPFPKLYVQSYNIESELKDAGITNINKG